MAWFKKKKEIVEIEKITTDLYLLLEGQKTGIVEYFYGLGIHITEVTSDTEQLTINLMMTNNKMRLLIVESGLGRIKSVSERENIKTIINTCLQDENKDITILYSSKAFRTELMKEFKEYKELEFIKYKNTSSIFDTLNKYENEEYDGEMHKEVISDGNNFKGVEDPEYRQSNEFRVTYKNMEEVLNDRSGEDGINGYKVDF